MMSEVIQPRPAPVLDARGWRETLLPILQNRLLDESALIRFGRDRGIGISGVVSGDPSQFLDLGWLQSDHPNEDEPPRFHPFRIYQIHHVVEACKLHITPSSSINREGFLEFLHGAVEHLPSLQQIEEHATRASRVADLAILLEPLYWPRITSHTTWSGANTFEDHQQLIEAHRAWAMQLLRELDAEEWSKAHERLRWDAAELDPNGDLYMLLRLSPWSKRKRVKGRISGGMWFRNMAEVIRRGFEDAVGAAWLEEDQDYGYWFPGARAEVYGFDRPLDTPAGTRPYIAFQFGLRTGSVVRWYLEGETEYHATVAVLPSAATGGIELVNLRGAIASERANAPLKLADSLVQDREQRRFSIITFDTDVDANRRTIQRQVENGNVVGYVAAHTPDFEFHNFSLRELVEVAARLDESIGESGTGVREHDWTGVWGAREFGEIYCRISDRLPRSLKGDEWGEALAKYALEFPDREDTGERRPFLETVEVALRALRVSYDHHRDTHMIDPQTFDLVRREKG